MSPRFMYTLGGILMLFSVVYGLSLIVPQVKSWSENPATTTPYRIVPLPSVVTTSSTTNTSHSADEEQLITALPPSTQSRSYLEITTGCALSIDGTCVTAHSKPNASSTVRASLRVGIVLLIGGSTTSPDGTTWYEIVFDEPLRYSDRLTIPWYVPAKAGIIHMEPGIEELSTTTPSTTKSLLVDRSEQKLYAYEGDDLVQTYTISTGLELTPTPRGTFTVYRKTPTRYMQGPIPGINSKYYDLPGVPWNLYFTKQGAVVHGAYWHNSFGRPYSSGCVNVDPKEARALYEWADLGMNITVRD